MAFRSSSISTKFDSENTHRLIDICESSWDAQIAEERNRMPSKCIAPSSFRCDRASWFRLRGVTPNKIHHPDRSLDFSAKLGEYIHSMIQSRLEDALGDDWIDVESHVSRVRLKSNYECKRSGHETIVEFSDPPVKFACDGILQLDSLRYLLEIKTVSYSKWRDLSGILPEHIDQVHLYMYLLKISNAMVMYVDRQYGQFKCYSTKLGGYDMRFIGDKLRNITESAESNIAPAGLELKDKWCNESMCSYYDTCKEYGRR